MKTLSKIVYDPGLFPNPSLLLLPNVPKPLHGLNPRTLLGQEWWDKVRKPAAAQNGFRCWTCGRHKKEGVLTKWLDGHEVYKYNYAKGTGELIFVSSLCRACHNFIHNGRTAIVYTKGEISWDEFTYVMYNGFSVLKAAGLPPSPFALSAYHSVYKWNVAHGKDVNYPNWHLKAMELVPEALEELASFDDEPMADWSKWTLRFDGKVYQGLFENSLQWMKKYNPELLEKRIMDMLGLEERDYDVYD